VIGLFIALCFIFLATTLDSSAYVLASVTSRNLSGHQEPRRWIRIVWALLLALVGIGLIKTGSLKPVQTSSIIAGLPMIAVLFVLAWSMLRMLKADYQNQPTASNPQVPHAHSNGI